MCLDKNMRRNLRPSPTSAGETKPNIDQSLMTVLAQASNAITSARTIDEAAKSVLDAARTILPNAIFVLQVWYLKNRKTAEFSLIKSSSCDNHLLFMEAVSSLLEQDSSNGEMPLKCQVLLSQQQLNDLLPTIKSTPYIQCLKIILPRKATNKVY